MLKQHFYHIEGINIIKVIIFNINDEIAIKITKNITNK
jgi:hypothetical protein